MPFVKDGSAAHLPIIDDTEQRVTAMYCIRYLGSTPGSDAESSALRIPLQASHQTACTWLHDFGYQHKKGNEYFALTEGKHASRSILSIAS